MRKLHRLVEHPYCRRLSAYPSEDALCPRHLPAAPPFLITGHAGHYQTKTRQTTHHQDDADSIVVTRKRHVFEGRRLFVIRSLVRRGVPEFLVILPDGSRTLIPAAWTDRNGGLDTKPSSTLVASVDGL